jgi:hypothetical protein
VASALNWTTLQTALLAALAEAPPPYNAVPPDFAELYPQATSYAEGRITRDIPLLADRTQDTSLTTGTGRTVAMSGMTNLVVVPEGISLITPSGTTNPALGVRVPYDMASLDVIDLLYPNEATVVAPSLADWTPRYWALRDNQDLVIGPTPGANYTIEVTGLFQPTPISSANPSTYLSTTYPELLTMACLVWLEAWLHRNFQPQASTPQAPFGAEQQYQVLMEGVRDEEIRRRGLRPNIPLPPAPKPTPP